MFFFAYYTVHLFFFAGWSHRPASQDVKEKRKLVVLLFALRGSGAEGARPAPASSATTASSVVVPAPSVAASAPACPDAMVLVPAGTFFMGSDDWSYGLRFPTFELRDAMLAEFGEELGFFDLQGHN